MATVNSGRVPAHRIAVGDFLQQVYLPWIAEHTRSTANGYRDIWEDQLKPLSEQNLPKGHSEHTTFKVG